MTTYGPWVQPDDTEAPPSTTWYAGTAPDEGTIADVGDAAAFSASVAAAIAGVSGVVPAASTITAGLTTTAAAQMTLADKLDLPGSTVAAIALLALLSPGTHLLSYPQVAPDDVPPNAVDTEYEATEGVPVPGTLRIYGYSVIFAASSGSSNQAGARLNRLFPGDYTVDGLGRPQSTWSQIRTGGSPVETFAPPGVSGTYAVAAFEITDQTLDANDRAVYAFVDLLLDGSWLATEASNGQLRSVAPLAPPSAGILPFFTQTYTPPRYRFVYDVVPPLRQFPRSDGLVGTGGARQRSAGSRQASNRQGWSGTYW